jgi:hypothetical protein
MKIAKFTKPLTIALHPEVYEEIKQITDDKKISMAEWVREVMEKALKFKQKENLME